MKIKEGMNEVSQLNFSNDILNMLEKRYLKTNEDGEVVETPEEMFMRVASNVASVNKEYDDDRSYEKERQEFFKFMNQGLFMPNSPALMNAGTEMNQLAACFVIDVPDSMEGIFQGIKDMALIQKSGGGVGMSFSKLRPKGDQVQSTGGVSSGPISFMSAYDSAIGTVRQGGKRRGASIGIMDISHPDIEKFIESKSEEGKLKNFNISVAIDDEFMEAVKKDGDYELVNPRTGRVSKTVKARNLYEKICEGAWKNGEPGVIFLDTINRDNPFEVNGPNDPHYITSTNPCGEICMESWEACNLGHINLSRIVEDGEIDWGLLEHLVDMGVRFLDNVVDASDYPLDKITEKVQENRKIGLGVMGWHDLLMQLEIPYDSKEAIDLAERIMSFIYVRAKDASCRIAKERGCFPTFEDSKYEHPMRNATLLTIAPTGSTSMIADASSSIEPVFGFSYRKGVMDEEVLMVNDYLLDYLIDKGEYSEDVEKKIEEEGSIQDIDEISDEAKRIFKTSSEIDYEWHIKMQSTFQKYVDNSISKTINASNDATIEDVKESFMMAWEKGCKGMTFYREGSRQEEALKKGKEDGDDVEYRKDVVSGETERIEVGCGKTLWCTINSEGDEVKETFVTLGKTGGCINSFTQSIGRLASISLQHGVSPEVIVKQLKGIRCPNPSFSKKHRRVLSCSDAVGKSIERYLNKIDEQDVNVETDIGLTTECPDCDEGWLVYEEGCVHCSNKRCGYTQC